MYIDRTSIHVCYIFIFLKGLISRSSIMEYVSEKGV